jgi:hypothetical protein
MLLPTNIKSWIGKLQMCRYRDNCFNRVLAPEGESLSFASPSHMDVVNVENAGAFFHKRKEPK